ncbi:Polyketide cyclase/dehydrase [metagenome]|uniref:Polyketide cyclase/dehydrase n=1 Tax=metagenome TaxID=256318 RepID=A0A2P2BYL8_9ZZZZ
MSSRIVSASATILAPPEVVFAILADPRQHARIDGSGSVKALTAGPDRLERGSEFGMDMKLYGLPYKIRNRVVEFEESRLIAWRHFGGHRWRYELTPVEAGTSVTESFDYSRYHPLAAKVLEALDYPGKNRRGIEATLVRLKDAAEADAPR